MANFFATLFPWVTRKSTSDPHDKPHPKESITKTNYEDSTLHSLPSELIFAIDGFLQSEYTIAPNVAKMAFRATCRRFFAILPGPKPVYLPSSWPEASDLLRGRWKEWDRRAYSQMLRSAWFRDLCREEREGAYGGDRLVCCVCRAFHSKQSFSPAERKKDPEQRTCMGAHGVLEVCPHMRLTFMALKLRPSNIICPRPHYSCGGDHGSVRVVKFNEESGAKDQEDDENVKGKKLKIEAELRILDLDKLAKQVTNEELEEGEVERGGYWARDEIVRAVKSSGWKFCSHVRAQSAEHWLTPLLSSHSPVTLSNFLSPGPLIPPSTSSCLLRWPKTKVLSSSSFAITHKCSASDCDTQINIFRSKLADMINNVDGTREEKNYLIMRVDRDLGKMKGADGAKWMSQIVEPSRLDEDRFDFSVDGKDNQGANQEQKTEEGSEQGRNTHRHGCSSGCGLDCEHW